MLSTTCAVFFLLGPKVTLIVEFVAHFYASNTCIACIPVRLCLQMHGVEMLRLSICRGLDEAFIKSPYNMIDFCALLPLAVRCYSGTEIPTLAENLWVHYALTCFVPLIRLLKLVRRFQKLQLLLFRGWNSMLIFWTRET